jgi:hypothetical protein
MAGLDRVYVAINSRILPAALQRAKQITLPLVSATILNRVPTETPMKDFYFQRQ